MCKRCLDKSPGTTISLFWRSSPTGHAGASYRQHSLFPRFDGSDRKPRIYPRSSLDWQSADFKWGKLHPGYFCSYVCRRRKRVLSVRPEKQFSELMFSGDAWHFHPSGTRSDLKQTFSSAEWLQQNRSKPSGSIFRDCSAPWRSQMAPNCIVPGATQVRSISGAGVLFTSLNSPSHPGSMCALCWMYFDGQKVSALA